MNVGKFENFLVFEKRYSRHTSVAYINDLGQFINYLSESYPNCSLNSITSSEVRSWMVSLMEKGINPSSIHRKISTLRSYFNFIIREGIVDQNPILKIQIPKKTKKIPVFLTEQKMSDLLDHNLFKKDIEGIRDRLILELFYCTGIRLSEFLFLKEVDIDFENSQIKVLGKRNKERIIPIPESLKIHIVNYIEAKNFAFTAQPLSESYLLVTDSGKAIYPKWIYRKVKYFLSLVSTAQKRSPHILRHTFATHLLNRGADINAIKELLGHSGLGATQVYTHNSTERIKLIYNLAHPKA